MIKMLDNKFGGCAAWKRARSWTGAGGNMLPQRLHVSTSMGGIKALSFGTGLERMGGILALGGMIEQNKAKLLMLLDQGVGADGRGHFFKSLCFFRKNRGWNLTVYKNGTQIIETKILLKLWLLWGNLATNWIRIPPVGKKNKKEWDQNRTNFGSLQGRALHRSDPGVCVVSGCSENRAHFGSLQGRALHSPTPKPSAHFTQIEWKILCLLIKSLMF